MATTKPTTTHPHPPPGPALRHLTLFLCALLLALTPSAIPAAPPKPPALEYHRLVKGFVAETLNSFGHATEPAFPVPNPWGQYTAYLLATNASGQRSWRIEHYLPGIGSGKSQGSTMYLFEGAKRALLIDTANPATATEGVNDLKTVVRHLLGHRNDGSVNPHPLDFVVANTHSHGDHIGENARMSDRIVYYMDGDWPANAPANYVPAREGGGPTTHGNGMAVGEIDLGGRIFRAIAVPPHTKGSTAWLDADNRIIVTGDAIGSSWPYVQAGPLTVYAETLRHLEQVTAPYPDIAVLPAHFYQVSAFERGGAPLDRRYILDQLALVNEVLAGKAVGEPFIAGRTAYWAKHGTAQMVYALTTMARPGETLPTAWHAVRIPGGFKRSWSLGQNDIDQILDIRTELYLIHKEGGDSLYLVKGSAGALLIGAGKGSPGLETLVRALIGPATPLDLALVEAAAPPPATLAALAPRRVYDAVGPNALAEGQTIDLGRDSAGRPLLLEAHLLGAPRPLLTLLATGDRLMFAGKALGRPGDPMGLELADPTAFQTALSKWQVPTKGRFDRLYLAGNTQWFAGAGYIDQLYAALDRTHSTRGTVKVDDKAVPGFTRYLSDGDLMTSAAVLVRKGE